MADVPRILVSAKELYHRRGTVLRNLLAPLLPTPPNVRVDQIGLGRQEFTLGVLAGSQRPNPSVDPNEVFVPTRVRKFLMNYYEVWKPKQATDHYYLFRAYMHFHFVGGPDRAPIQILSLHCDPALHGDEEHYRYKRGPHLHVNSARPDVGRAHISLCINDDQLGGDDIRLWNKNFQKVVRMISEEVVPRWERGAG